MTVGDPAAAGGRRIDSFAAVETERLSVSTIFQASSRADAGATVSESELQPGVPLRMRLQGLR